MAGDSGGTVVKASASAFLGREAPLTLLLAAFGIAGMVSRTSGTVATRQSQPDAQESTVAQLELWEDPLAKNVQTTEVTKTDGLKTNDFAVLVHVPERMTPDQREDRIRIRYAVQIAMAHCGFKPDQTSGTIFQLPSGTVSDAGEVRYEDFLSPDTTSRCRIVWTALSTTNRQKFCWSLIVSVQSNTCGSSCKFLVMGPRRSDELQSLLGSGGAVNLTNADSRVSNPQIASYIATVSSEGLGVANVPPNIRRTCPLDAKLCRLLAGEILLRTRLNGETNNIRCIAIAERDTLYGRTLPQQFQAALSNACKAASTSPRLIRPQVDCFWYLRGIDGLSEANGFKPSNTNDLRFGASQLDAVEQSLREAGRTGSRVHAVAVLGSDPHDKVQIMQLARKHLPHALILTTDADSLYLGESLFPRLRNIIVASAPPRAQVSVSNTAPIRYEASFRDPYQALLVTSLTHWLSSQGKSLPAATDPQLFELARAQYVPLTCGELAVDHSVWRTLHDLQARTSPVVFAVVLLLLLSMAAYAVLLGVRIVFEQKTKAHSGYRFSAIGLWTPWRRKGRRLSLSQDGLYSLLVLFVCLGAISVVSACRVAKGIPSPSSLMLAGIGDHGEPLSPITVSILPTLVVQLAACLLSLIGIARLLLASRKVIKYAEWADDSLDGYSIKFQTTSIACSRPTRMRSVLQARWQLYRRFVALWMVPVSCLIVLPLALYVWPSIFMRYGQAFPVARGRRAMFAHLVGTLCSASCMQMLFWLSFVFAAGSLIMTWVLIRARTHRRRFLHDRKADPLFVLPELVEARNELADAHVIVEVTRRLGRVIFIPFAVLLMMAGARSPLFDNFSFNQALYSLYTFHAFSLIALSACISFVGITGRRRMLWRLEALLLDVKKRSTYWAPGASPRRAPLADPMRQQALTRLTEYRERIAALDEGAFAPLLSQPVIYAALLPFASSGLQSMLPAFFRLF